MFKDSKQTQSKTTLIARRMFMLTGLKLAVFLGIVGRLFYLQISENIKYRSLSDKNRLREWKLPPQRGIIEDFFGKKIAGNTQLFQLHMTPEDVPNFEELFFRLSKLINFNERQRRSLLKKIKKRKPWEPVIISDNLTWSEFSKLNLFLHEMQGIKPVVAVTRKYSQDGSFSHLIGYVSDVSQSDLENSEFLRKVHVPGLKTGKTGLEKSLNELMVGEVGYQRYEVNAYGKRVKELKFLQGTTGKNFRTTLDMDIQKFANKSLKDKSGSICVMDIYTGDMIAMVSSPTFDPNKFVHGITSKDWQNLLNDDKKPLINKSIAGLYPPGSTIKPIVALSALENDVVSPNTTVECKGEIELYGHKYHCWKEKGHGFLRLREAIKQSCDIYFYEVARRLGVDRLAVTANKFGLGNKVFNILNEERTGLVPTTKWKSKNIGKGWVIGETLLAGIGQGYFQTTPIQLCLMTSQLANGGYKIKPRIIDDKNALEPVILAWKEEFVYRNKNKSDFNTTSSQTADPPINIGSNLVKLYRNPENVKFILDAQFGATNEPMGTSYRSRHVKSDYIFAGKTGTSQLRTITKEERELKLKQKDLPYKRRDHALFTAFAPYKNPRYAFSVVIEHGGTGSSAAAPIAKRVIKRVIDRHQLRKKYQQDLFQEV
jgi:penicillin-binding protein 2